MHYPRNGCFRRTGFTLIELLVVISIIALLVSILLPALNEARSTARRVICSGNLRSTAGAMHQYATDFKGMLPHQSYWSSGGSTTACVYQRSLLKANSKTDVGPIRLLKPFGQAGLYDTGIIEEYEIFYCPGVANYNDPTSGMAYGSKTSMVFNPEHYTRPGTHDWDIDYHPSYNMTRVSYHFFKNNIKSIDKMSSKSYMYDIVWKWAMIPHKSSSGQPKGMNVAYGDGHVVFNTDPEIFEADDGQWGDLTAYAADDPTSPNYVLQKWFPIIGLAGNNIPSLDEITGRDYGNWRCNENLLDGARKGWWEYAPE